MKNVKYSLVLATLNPNLILLERFFESLKRQTLKNFELIVVEQSIPPRSKDLICKFSDSFDVVFVESEKGLSKARNVGAKFANGSHLLFPDDDCWYDPDFFYSLTKTITKDNYKILTFRAANEKGVNIAKFDSTSGTCDKFNIWRRVSSISMCITKRDFELLKGFDESLGLGSGTLTSACEDIELPLRAIDKNITVIYNSEIVSRHDLPIQRAAHLVIERARTHMYSVGYIYRRYNYPMSFVLYSVIRNLVAMLLFLLKRNPTMFKYHYFTFIGKLSGYFGLNLK